MRRTPAVAALGDASSCGTLGAEQGSLLRQTVTASAALTLAPGSRQPAHQLRAQQLGVALAAVGVQLNLAAPRPVGRAALREACWQRQLEMLQTTASREGATRLQHYVFGVHGTLDAASLATPAGFITHVRERCRREALAQWRTRSHWGAEESGCWQGVPREQRLCTYCSAGIETLEHMIFDCPLYSDVCSRVHYVFPPDPPSLYSFLQKKLALSHPSLPPAVAPGGR